jgi:hypothetical protein
MEWKLIEEITKASVSKSWPEAKKEWEISNIYFNFSPSATTCICGHPHIKEVIIIRNKLNRSEMIVGNHCIKTVMGFNHDLFFHAIARNKLNEAVIEQGHNDYLISDWERQFLLDTWLKRKLTTKQHVIFDRLKRNIVKFYQRGGGAML